MPTGHKRPHALDWSLPQVMRVETSRGQASLIIHRGIVEHASPAMAWSLGWSMATLERRLVDLQWIFTMVMPESITYPTRRV